MNKALLLSLQKGIVKELCLKKLLTEEQTQLAIKEFEQVYEQNIIKEGSEENAKSNQLL
ncbi:MAG: hypothetical protein V8R72_00325 [Clostridia bacterium]